MGYLSELRKIIGTRPIIMAGAAIILLNEKREVLLQRRTDSGDWGTIGGALELKESFEEAAERELFEEAGLRSKDFKFVTVLSGEEYYYRYPNGDEVYNVIAVFETHKYEGKPSVNDDEGSEVKFFSLEEPIVNLNMTSYKILKNAGYITW